MKLVSLNEVQSLLDKDTAIIQISKTMRAWNSFYFCLNLPENKRKNSKYYLDASRKRNFEYGLCRTGNN